MGAWEKESDDVKVLKGSLDLGKLLVWHCSFYIVHENAKHTAVDQDQGCRKLKRVRRGAQGRQKRPRALPSHAREQ